MKAVVTAWMLVIAATMTSCAPFVNSPFSDEVLSPERNLNEQAIGRLGDIEADGKIRFAVLADAHQNYRDLDRTIHAINRTPDLDFVVNLGDFTNSGYNFEYDQYIDSYLALRAPSLTVLGNHDAIGVGRRIYHRVFGESNFVFESASRRFVFFNSNNLEDRAHFDPSWLKDQVTGSAKKVFVFTHVDLKDNQRFFDSTAATFASVIGDANTQLILNGHNHVYAYHVESGTVMLQSPRVEDVQWLLVEVQGNQFTVQRMGGGGGNESATLK